MRLFVAAAILMIAAPLFAQDPTDILVYHDTESGYGTAVTTAIDNLWPSCNVSDNTGGESGMINFNNDLYSQDWDLIIVECWYYDTDDLDWATLNDIYDTNTIFATCWEWMGGTSGQMDLANSMGVTNVSTISSLIPHYAWDEAHPICDGIGDWSWEDPGLMTLNNRMTVSDAIPVTGWTADEQSGEAGICVANDGSSVISGYTPGYAVEDVAIWENILQFMWGDEALVPTTWGSIKAGGLQR